MEFTNPFANNTLTATYQINTPMFLGGADGCADTITPQSFKGLMRFWWRAWQWQHAKGSDDSEKLADLHHKEALLFGSSAKIPNTNTLYGQGAFTLHILGKPELEQDKPTEKKKTFAAEFMLYGPIARSKDSSKNTLKKYIKTTKEHKNQKNGVFTVQLTLIDTSTETAEALRLGDVTIEEHLTTLLKLVGTIGNLGSRSRNGWGSIQITELNGGNITTALNDFSFLQPDITSAPYTAFSNQTIYKILSGGSDWKKMFNKLSDRYEDELKSLEGNPQKRVYGMPKEKHKFNKKKKNERRSSLLFFHFHQDGSTMQIYAILMPSNIFHPDAPKDFQADYALVEKFMERLSNEL